MRYSLILPALSIAAFSSGCYENFSAPQRLTPDVDRVLGAYGIAVDTSDRIHALYHAEFQGPGLTIRTSADGGENWDQWSTVAAYDRQNSFLDSARLRADRVNPDNLYVSYRVRCDNRQVINFRRSVDGGQNWSEAEALSGESMGHALHGGPAGRSGFALQGEKPGRLVAFALFAQISQRLILPAQGL